MCFQAHCILRFKPGSVIISNLGVARDMHALNEPHMCYLEWDASRDVGNLAEPKWAILHANFHAAIA